MLPAMLATGFWLRTYVDSTRIQENEICGSCIYGIREYSINTPEDRRVV